MLTSPQLFVPRHLLVFAACDIMWKNQSEVYLLHDATIISHVKHFGQIRSSSSAIKGFPTLGRRVSSPNEAPGANLPSVRYETAAK
ncbi:hypothetical protein ROHU_011620 [Labeo rohita]|uniref:Uncharacterized protein n=1 Tax=Labeo rohita TaxID=84645 RepID=A0A498LS56_LABRO|nr:hypothetical protein ROHU_011620 [Labeo rohita]